MGLSNDLSCEAGSLSCCRPNPHAFSSRDLRLYFPALELWVAWSLSLPRHSSWFIYARMWGLRVCQSPPCGVHQPPPCHESSLPRLPLSAPPTSLDECFFFISLVVRLSYSSIFCQFWLLFVFKLLLSFFWLCKETQCVYLCLHVGRKFWEMDSSGVLGSFS